MTQLDIPVDCGKRLILHYIHQTAINDPDCVCISIPLTNEPRDGFEDITFSQLDKAIDATSAWFRDQFSHAQGSECIPYIGPHDLRYVLLMLAAVKTEHNLFVPSPRNSLEANVSLLEKCQCNTFLVAEDSASSQKIVKDIQTRVELRVLNVPGLNYFLHPSFDVPHYPYTKSYEDAKYDPLVTMHTSGTTGIPKPVVMRQGILTSLDACQKIPSLYKLNPFNEIWRGKRIFHVFPLFHAAGMGAIMNGLYYKHTVVLPPPIPLTAQIANEVFLHGRVKACQIPPAILVESARVPEYLENLGRLEYLATGGGPLPKPIGDLVSSKTHLFLTFGTTEMGPMSCCIPTSREDWDYLDFSAIFGVELRHYSDNLFELVFIRDSAVEEFEAIFYTFPELSEYKTSDLFSKHPSKNNLWRHEGRSDDIIVYSTGEKFNPVSMEGELCSDENIKTAIIYGNGQFQSALLIEAEDPENSKETLLEKVWPAIKRANATCPAHARVDKNFVVFTTNDKPIPRSGKGTVQRKLALKLYATELDELYKEITDEVNGNGVRPNKLTGNNDLQDIIFKAVSSLDGFENISTSDDLFENGMDSLGVISLIRALKSAFKSRDFQLKPLSESIIYKNASVDSLVAALTDDKTRDKDGQDAMQREYDRYVFDLPVIARPAAEKSGPNVFLLTGSTGSLGSYILSSLLTADKHCKVYCLNRGNDSESRQRKSNESKDLPTDFDRVEFLSMGSGAGENWLGLDLPKYKIILEEVTHVIHNAWHVDFNVSLAQLGPTHLRRVRQLIDFSAHSKHGCSIHFISSISSVRMWDVATSAPSHSRVPEEPFEDWAFPQNSGYGQAKFVAERLLIAACRNSNITATIYRVGQIAGPKSSKGKWNESEWFPLILRSSIHLKALPSTLGPHEAVDWIPVDVLGKVVQELVVGSDTRGTESTAKVYHLVNPKCTTYAESLLPSLTSLLKLPTITFTEWVELLRDSAATTQDSDIEKNPGVKLLEFYEGLAAMEANGRAQVSLDTKKAVESSLTLNDIDVVDGLLMKNWLAQWGLI